MEINGNPWRLELDWRWHRKALELGCLLSINPDAHSIAELDLVRWGVAVARKGGVQKQDVLNAMSLTQSSFAAIASFSSIRVLTAPSSAFEARLRSCFVETRLLWSLRA